MKKIIVSALGTFCLLSQMVSAENHAQSQESVLKENKQDEKVCFANINSRKETTQEILNRIGCKKGDKIVISQYFGKLGIPYLYAVAVTSARVCDYTQSVLSNNVAQNTVTTCVYTGTVLPLIGSSKVMKALSPK